MQKTGEGKPSGLSDQAKFYQKPILLLMGAPGVGKGTFGKMLSEDYGMPIFSTGEYLRELAKSNDQSELVKKIREIMKEGKLVDDATIQKIIERRLFEDEPKNAKGIILDGYPRTTPQAQLLDKTGKVKAAVNFFLKENILVEKLAGRRECDKCRTPYNISSIKKEGYDMDPLLPKKNPEICDKDGGKLIQREDDTEKVIIERLKTYKEKTKPLEDYYKSKGVLFEFEPKQGV